MCAWEHIRLSADWNSKLQCRNRLRASLRSQGVPGKKIMYTVCTTAVLQMLIQEGGGRKKKRDTAAHKPSESVSLLIARGVGRRHSSSQAGKCPPLHPCPAHLTSGGPRRSYSHLKALAFLCQAKLEASCPPPRVSWHCFSSSALVRSWESARRRRRLRPSSEKLCANPTAATHLLLHNARRHTSDFFKVLAS